MTNFLKALIHASRSAASPAHRLLPKTCRGLLFFGVPQLGLRNEKLISVVKGRPNENLIRALVVNDESEPSSFLRRMSDDFAHSFQGQLRVVCFYEGRRSATVEVHFHQGFLGSVLIMVSRYDLTARWKRQAP